MIHSLIPPFFSKIVEIFTSVEAYRYTQFAYIIYLANLFGEIINTMHIVAYMQQYDTIKMHNS